MRDKDYRPYNRNGNGNNKSLCPIYSTKAVNTRDISVSGNMYYRKPASAERGAFPRGRHVRPAPRAALVPAVITCSTGARTRPTMEVLPHNPLGPPHDTCLIPTPIAFHPPFRPAQWTQTTRLRLSPGTAELRPGAGHPSASRAPFAERASGGKSTCSATSGPVSFASPKTPA